MKFAKFALYTVGAVAGLVGVALVAVILIVNGSFVKGRLEKLMADKHRTLKIEGVPALTLFPVARITMGKLSLSELNSDTTFISLDSADIAVRVMPYFSGVIQLEEMNVLGLNARVVSDKNGKLNYGDLLDPNAPYPNVHVGAVNIDRAKMFYRDDLTGQQLTLVEMKFTTGRLDGVVAGPVALDARIVGHEPEVDLKATMSGALRFDLNSQEIGAEKFALKVGGRYDTDTVSVNLNVPRIEITPARATGSAVDASLKLSGPARQVTATFKMAAVEGSAAAFSFPEIAAAWNAKLKDKSFTGNAKASVKASLSKHTLDATLATKLDESNIKATVNVANTAPLDAKFDISVDQIDLDRYISPTKSEVKSDPKTAVKPDTLIDLSMLKGKTVNGTFHAGALKMSRAKLQAVAVTVKLADGTLVIGPHAAQLYGGTVAGTVSISADSNRLVIAEQLDNVAVGTLMQELSRQDRFNGRGSVNLDLRSHGASFNAMKHALNGTVKVVLKDAAIKGVNLAERVRNVKATLLRRKEVYDPTTKTDFSEMRMSIAIKNGVASSNDLHALSPFIRLGGIGTVDFGRNTISYVANAKVVVTSVGQGGREANDVSGVNIPINVVGSLDKPEWHIDYSGLARGVAGSAGTLAKKGVQGAGTLAKNGAGSAGTLAKKGAGGAGEVAKKGASGVGGVLKGIGGRFRKKDPPT